MLRIHTTNDKLVFNSPDESRVYGILGETASRNGNWTPPIQLNNGKTIIFQLRNIIAIEKD